MGKRVLLKCPACGYEKEMSVGIGLGSRNELVVEECLQAMDRSFWNQLKAAGKIDFFSSRQEVGYCADCNQLREAFLVEIQTTTGTKLVLGDKCSRCNHRLQIFDIEQEIVCPNCKKQKLDKRMIGLWD